MRCTRRAVRCARCVLVLSASKWIGRERLAAECCPVPSVSCLFLPCTAELCLLLWVGSNPKITITSQIAAVSPAAGVGHWSGAITLVQLLLRQAIPETVKIAALLSISYTENQTWEAGQGSAPHFVICASFWGGKKNKKKKQPCSSSASFSSWTSWSGSSAQWSWGFSAGAHDREVSGLPRVELTHASEQHQLHWETVIRVNDPGYRKQLFLFITAQKAMRRTLQLKEVGNFRSVLGNPPNKVCLGYQGNVLVI